MMDKKKIELISLIIIVSVVVFLLLGIILASRPMTLYKEAKNTTRISHMQTILGAVYLYAIDNQGKFPACIPGQGAVTASECAELIPYLYLGRFPLDPDPKEKYMMEYVPETKDRIRIFSTSPESKGTELMR